MQLVCDILLLEGSRVWSFSTIKKGITFVVPFISISLI